MVILIAGASHTGKTLLAQRLMEKYHHPYLSIDHLKMGLIRSGQTTLTPMDDDKLTDYLWPIVREMVKTAIENGQNLIVEGCYIPFDWKKDFSPEYLSHIRYCCLIMSRNYIESHFADIRNHGNAIEHRLDDSGLSKDVLIQENERNLRLCRENRCEYILLNDHYDINLEIFHISHCVRAAHLKDMALAADIMVTSFRTAFAAFVSPETMDACTNPDNCRAMLENIYREGKMHFLMGGDQGFLCWQETDGGAEIVAIHSLPDSWGTGLGHAILKEALTQIGDCPVHLWAFKENTRARRFYEKHGFHWDGSERVSEFDGAFEVRYVHSSGEIWDAYCADGTLAGQDLVRGEPPVATALEAVRGQLAQLQLQQENIWRKVCTPSICLQSETHP